MQAVASITALEFMSPASRKVFTEIIMGELMKKGLVTGEDKEGELEGEGEMGNSD